MVKLKPANWKLFRFVGTVYGFIAVAVVAILLFSPYEQEVIVREVNNGTGAKVPINISRDIVAWGADAALGAAIPLFALAALGVFYALAANLGNNTQRLVSLILVFVSGGFILPWGYDRVNETEFVAAEAWRGFGSVVALVAALVLSHLFYYEHHRRKLGCT